MMHEFYDCTETEDPVDDNESRDISDIISIIKTFK